MTLTRHTQAAAGLSFAAELALQDELTTLQQDAEIEAEEPLDAFLAVFAAEHSELQEYT